MLISVILQEALLKKLNKGAKQVAGKLVFRPVFERARL
jgi:hypothetical protein